MRTGRANRQRGEIEAVIDGERRILCMTLGALAEARFSSAKRKVPERAKLFFFSDGAYEFPVAGGGTGTLADFIGAVQGTAGMERGECAFLQARAAALCAEREFPDDFTIVCARFSG